ncbi:hypothetical protein Tco_0688215 [Tanacetum coccineum]
MINNSIAIGERPAEVTDDNKWDEMDGNAVVNLHLALADGVLSSIEEKKSAKEIYGLKGEIMEEAEASVASHRQEGIQTAGHTAYTLTELGVAELDDTLTLLKEQEHCWQLLRLGKIILGEADNTERSNDSFEAVPQHEVNETTESQAPTDSLLIESGTPSNLQEALNNPDASSSGRKATHKKKLETLH